MHKSHGRLHWILIAITLVFTFTHILIHPGRVEVGVAPLILQLEWHLLVRLLIMWHVGG